MIALRYTPRYRWRMLVLMFLFTCKAWACTFDSICDLPIAQVRQQYQQSLDMVEVRMNAARSAADASAPDVAATPRRPAGGLLAGLGRISPPTLKPFKSRTAR